LSYFEALRRTSATTAVIILLHSPAFVALGAAVFLRRNSSQRPKFTALIMAFAGCFLVAGGYDRELISLNPTGVCSGLYSSHYFTLPTRYSANTRFRNISSWTNSPIRIRIRRLLHYVLLQVGIWFRSGIFPPRVLAVSTLSRIRPDTRLVCIFTYCPLAT